MLIFRKVSSNAERKLVHLDLVRGLAALAVCAGHLQALPLVSLSEVRSAANPSSNSHPRQPLS